MIELFGLEEAVEFADQSSVELEYAESPLEDGQFAICVIGKQNAEPVVLEGWEEITRSGNDTFTQSILVRRIDDASSEPDTYEFEWDTPANGIGFVISLHSDTPAKIGLGLVSSNGGAGTPHTCTGVRAIRDDSAAFLIETSNSNDPSTAQAGWVDNAINAFTDFASMINTKQLAEYGDLSGNVSYAGGVARWANAIISFYEFAPMGATIELGIKSPGVHVPVAFTQPNQRPETFEELIYGSH